ncbi:MAG: OmpH family outer membrane protein [Pseudomonadota bacterium]
MTGGAAARFLLGAALLAVCLSGEVAAQDIPQAPLLTLDQERLFAESRFGMAIQKRYDDESATLLAENRRIEAALEQEERDLTDRRATLPQAEFQTLAEAFDAKVEEIRTAQDAKSRALTRRREEERQRFIQAVVPVLGEVMRETGAVAIIDKSAIILSFDRLDMTDTAIARIDAVLGDGTSPPAGADPAPGSTPTP